MHCRWRFNWTLLEGYEISTPNPEKINILDAMNLAISAWTTDIQARIIVNYFRHCKTSVHQYREFREFESTIGRIQQLQIVIKELSYRNTMDVEYILNYPWENEVTSELLTDEQLIEDIMGHDKDYEVEDNSTV